MLLRTFSCFFILIAASAWAAVRTEYRGFWVDTFNSSLSTHDDIEALVASAKAAKANALFAQVRRRGDSWYLNSLEPPPDFVPFAPGYDPLHDLIQTAHANQIEVHAFVIMGAVWNKNPNFAPTATLGPPTSPEHVFNRHSGFDPATGRIDAGSVENWLTRSLLPDGTAGITFQGHRFGAEFWLDFGHPAAAAYSADVVLHLVRNYDIDGLHLDRIRYPDFSAPGQTPASGVNVGYNAVSVWRFQERYGIPHDAPPPEPGDPLWSQWRRDQVTSVVRRVYLKASAIRPKLVVSAALITFGGGPVTEESWQSAEAYWRVFQDWRAWLEEGILDLAMPMNYKRENIAQQAIWLDQWNAWTARHVYNRAAISGLGAYLNGIEDSVEQVRRSLSVNPTGVAFYSFGSPDASGLGSAPFASALTREIFAEDAVVPRFSWKVAPWAGHLMGNAPGFADTAPVYLFNEQGHLVRTTSTDGNGFFGAVDLPAGEYVALISLSKGSILSNPVVVSPGSVAVTEF